MAKKKLAATVKIQIQAGQATPAPPVGTALGPHGINIMDFCKAYNAATENQRGLVIPAEIQIFEDRSFTFVTKTPPTPFLIRQAAGVEKGAQNVRTEKVGSVTEAQVRQIAETKMPDLNAVDLEGAMSQVRGTARSMGIDVERFAMTKHGKKYEDALKTYDPERLYPPADAFGLVKAFPAKSYDETVEVAIRLGVDPRKADQMIRGTVSLPHGTGKSARVIVFAQGDAAREAEAAGADAVGHDDLIQRIEGGFLDFDVAIATPDLMGQVGKLGRTLGPRGLMPNPKTGTVTNDIGKTVSEFKAGKVEYRTDRFGNVHVPVGKASFDTEALVENYHAILDEILRAKPAASKGRFIRSASASRSMGPSVKIDPAFTHADDSQKAIAS